jgi:hypothetical protein
MPTGESSAYHLRLKALRELPKMPCENPECKAEVTFTFPIVQAGKQTNLCGKCFAGVQRWDVKLRKKKIPFEVNHVCKS